MIARPSDLIVGQFTCLALHFSLAQLIRSVIALPSLPSAADPTMGRSGCPNLARAVLVTVVRHISYSPV